MEKIRTVIVDDEVGGQVAVEEMIKATAPQFEVVGIADSVEEAHILISDKKPALVFLDIQLNDKTAFDLLNLGFSYSPEIVFVTAYDQYAIEAFKRNALSYLLKPFSFEEFRSVRDRVIQICSGASSSANLTPILETFRSKISIPTGTGREYIETSNIIFVEAQGSYSEINLRDKKPIMVSRPLKFIEDQIQSPQFFRAHRSFLVNVNSVIRWDKSDNGTLVLENDMSVPLSRDGKATWQQLQKI